MKIFAIISSILLGVFIVAGLSFGAGVVTSKYFEPTPSANDPGVYTPVQDKNLLNILRPVAVNNEFSDLTIKYGSLEGTELGNESNEILSDNTSHPTIEISPNTKSEDLTEAVAHEYLHAVWAKMDSNTQLNAERMVLNKYFNDPLMQNYMAGYRQKGTFSATELFSYYCTMYPDSDLPADLLQECQKYINRSAFTPHMFYKY